MSDKLVIAVGRGGMVNPDSHLPCGAKDAAAKFPEPAHISCPRCERRIKKLLMERMVEPVEVEVEQRRFEWD